MSSYPMCEAVSHAESPYLSVTCSVTATASMNPASRGWEVNHTGGMHQTQDMAQIPVNYYSYSSPTNTEAFLTQNQSAGTYCGADLSLYDGCPELDLQTEYPWASIYSGFEKVDSFDYAVPREDHPTCPWRGAGQTIPRENPHLANGSVSTTEYFPGQEGPDLYRHMDTGSCSALKNGGVSGEFTELHTPEGQGTYSEEVKYHGRAGERQLDELGRTDNPRECTNNPQSQFSANLTCFRHGDEESASTRINLDQVHPTDTPASEENTAQQTPHIQEQTTASRGSWNINSHYQHNPPNPGDHPQGMLLTSTDRMSSAETRVNSEGDQGGQPHAEEIQCNEHSQPLDTEGEQLKETTCAIDVDHMISSGVTVAGYKPRGIIRKRTKSAVPKAGKDVWYWEKRRKNNESARRSRELKKEKEKHFYRRALELEYENLFLKERIGFLETKLSSSQAPSTNMC